MMNNQVLNFLLGTLAGASVVTTYSIALQIRNLFSVNHNIKRICQ